MFCGDWLDHPISKPADQRDRDDLARGIAPVELDPAARCLVAVASRPSGHRVRRTIFARRGDAETGLEWIASGGAIQLNESK